MQLHVRENGSALYSKNGTDYTRRSRALKPALVNIRANSAVIDCELVACDDTGMPSFRTLLELGNEAPAICLWCFDCSSWTVFA
jgi:ATP-dependent DNA ligase